MTAGEAREVARSWVTANAGCWPGLRAAHLVGGVTSMPDEAPFPIDKDVDLHLIVAEESPVLADAGSWPRILEESFGGVAIEVGLKSIAESRTAETVLANPEIACHLTVGSVFHDPDGLLRGLQVAVRRDYPRRSWVLRAK